MMTRRGSASLAGAQPPAPAIEPAAPPPVVPLGPQIPRREVWLDVPEYPGFRVKVWANYPQALQRGMFSGDTAAAMDAYRQVVVEQNGWRDFDGEPYPPASDAAFWDAIPTELAVTLMRLVNTTAWTILPNAVSARNGTS